MDIDDKMDCSCGCGDCSTCDLTCGENGQKCPEGKCLGEEYKSHTWVAGMMYVHNEDVATIARNRLVECEKCGISYSPDRSDIQCI